MKETEDERALLCDLLAGLAWLCSRTDFKSKKETLNEFTGDISKGRRDHFQATLFEKMVSEFQVQELRSSMVFYIIEKFFVEFGRHILLLVSYTEFRFHFTNLLNYFDK